MLFPARRHRRARGTERVDGRVASRAVVVVTGAQDERDEGWRATPAWARLDRWLVTLVGFLGERPPTDLEGFVEYARTLSTNELHEVAAGATPIGEGVTGVFHEYIRRRYDRLTQFPERYVVSGDAVCSLNPIYAQGMTVAIGEAQTLGRIVDKHDLDRVGRRFFQQTRNFVDTTWTLATGADLAHPEVDGPRPMSWRLVNAYIDRLLPVAHRDSLVANAFMNVNALVAPPPQLFHPRILARVLRRPRTPDRQEHPEPVLRPGQVPRS